jgi:hypothetical protein
MPDMEWIKKHIASTVYYSDRDFNRHGVNRLTVRKVIEVQLNTWNRSDPEVTEEVIAAEIKRLIETGQLIEENGELMTGVPLFEHAQPVSEAAEKAAQKIWNDLKDRRGIRQEMDKLDDAVAQELRNTHAVLIDKMFGTTPKQSMRSMFGTTPAKGS